MKRSVGLVMCAAVVAAMSSTSANECEDLEAEIEVLQGLLCTSTRFNLEAEIAKETLSQQIESLKKEISSIQKDLKINEDCCNKEGENVVYTIIQQTGTGTHHGGTASGAYLFTLIGTEDETSPHDCSADRSEGSQSQCSFEDNINIGQLKAVKIENTSDDTWIFVNMAVEADGVVAGRWHGSMTVGDYLTKTISLNTNIVNGGWGCYGDWTECSAECGGGSQIRSRECSSPAPAHGGAQCEGDMDEFRECNTNPCPVDGGWNDYGDWSECSAECGGGTQMRSRTCTNPSPAHGGAQCEGNAGESQVCNIQPCPRNGNWTCWSDWTECSAECGGGTQTRSRSCNDPSPAYGGADCEGDDEETGSCNTNTCLNRCPASYPHVYFNGQHCCKTNREKYYRPQGTKCDGSVIRVDSLCCERDMAIRCPTGFCNER